VSDLSSELPAESHVNAPMAKADFISALVFFVLGVYMIEEGLKMPGAGGFIEVGGEPGKVPVLLGAIIAFFAVILLVRSVFRRGHRVWEIDAIASEDKNGIRRIVLTAAGCSFYAVGLLGGHFAGWEVMYHQATGLFIFVFITAFEWEFAPELGAQRWAWLNSKLPSLGRTFRTVFSFISPTQAPYVWIIAMALLQAVLVTWGVTYLFEQEFYVQLP